MRASLLLFVILGVAAGGHAAPDEIVTAHLAWEPGTVGAINAGRIPFRDAPPEGVEVPRGLSNPRYARIKMAGTKGLAVALDAVAESPRLWVDHDFDGNLANETVTHLARSGTSWFRRQVVLARYEDEKDVVPVPLYFRYAPAQQQDFVTVFARVHRRGTVVLGGRLRLLALVDNTFDACFDHAERDKLYLDLDGDGQFQATGTDPAERVLPGVPLRVGDEGWIARVTSPSGTAVEFTRTRDVPPARPRTWPSGVTLSPGRRQTPPAESYDVLRKRYEQEKGRTYAERYATVNLMGRVGTRAAFHFLIEVGQEDKDTSLRSAALRALGNAAYLDFGGGRVAALARKATKQTVSGLAQALFDMGHPDRDRIYLEMMKNADSAFVSAAARWLAASGTDKARAAVLAAMRDHPVPAGRYAAYTQGARNLPRGPPLAWIREAAKDDYPNLRAEAVKDLGVLGHPDARTLALRMAEERPVDLSIGMALAQVLGAAGDPKAVAALLAFLEDQALNANVRKSVLEQLRFIRAPGSVAVLVKALRSKASAVRALVAEILGSIPERDVTTALLRRAKQEKDPEVLPLLLEALGDHGDVVALEALLKRARSRRATEARRAAIRALARLGLGLPRVRDFFLALLGARGAEDRILALDAAGSSGDAQLCPSVIESLSHDAWQVRLAAVEALDALRCRPAVHALIECLGTEEEERVRDAIASVLFRLTGMNLYDNAQVWQRWWSEHGETFTVPETIPTLPEEHAGGTQAGFYGLPVKSERVVFVIDQSGSMSAPGEATDSDGEESVNRLDVAVRETLGAVAKLKNSARVNVILFHTTIHPWQDELQPLRGGQRKALQHYLEGKQPTGGTNLYDGLEMALKTKDVDTVFLLSDGVPGAGKYVTTADILRAVRRENQTRRVAIHCISIGLDSELLRLLAAENGGRYARR